MNDFIFDTLSDLEFLEFIGQKILAQCFEIADFVVIFDR
jgi:hypothetical protein